MDPSLFFAAGAGMNRRNERAPQQGPLWMNNMLGQRPELQFAERQASRDQQLQLLTMLLAQKSNERSELRHDREFQLLQQQLEQAKVESAYQNQLALAGMQQQGQQFNATIAQQGQMMGQQMQQDNQRFMLTRQEMAQRDAVARADISARDKQLTMAQEAQAAQLAAIERGQRQADADRNVALTGLAASNTIEDISSRAEAQKEAIAARSEERDYARTESAAEAVRSAAGRVGVNADSTNLSTTVLAGLLNTVPFIKNTGVGRRRDAILNPGNMEASKALDEFYTSRPDPDASYDALLKLEGLLETPEVVTNVSDKTLSLIRRAVNSEQATDARRAQRERSKGERQQLRDIASEARAEARAVKERTREAQRRALGPETGALLNTVQTGAPLGAGEISPEILAAVMRAATGRGF